MVAYPAASSSYINTFGAVSTIYLDEMNHSLTLDLTKNTVNITALRFDSPIPDPMTVNVTVDGNTTQYFLNLSAVYANFSSCELIDAITFQSANMELLRNVSLNIQLILCYISPSMMSSVRNNRKLETIGFIVACNCTPERDIMNQELILDSFDVDDTIPLDQMTELLSENFGYQSIASVYTLDIAFDQDQMVVIENVTAVMLGETATQWMMINYVLPDQSITEIDSSLMLNTSNTSSISLVIPCLSLSLLSGIQIIFGPTTDNLTLDNVSLTIEICNCSDLLFTSKCVFYECGKTCALSVDRIFLMFFLLRFSIEQQSVKRNIDHSRWDYRMEHDKCDFLSSIQCFGLYDWMQVFESLTLFQHYGCHYNAKWLDQLSIQCHDHQYCWKFHMEQQFFGLGVGTLHKIVRSRRHILFKFVD